MLSFLLIPASCQEVRFTKLENRKRSTMCSKYSSDYVRRFKNATWQKTDGAECSLGNYLEKEDHADAERRLNFYRWLVGFEREAYISTQYTKQCQECATNNLANGGLNHYPSSSGKCYTSGAATACGSSNLAMGTRNGADDIDLYIDDSSVDSLGHRRWCLNPSGYEYGLGRNNYYGSLKVFGTKSGDYEDITMNAYPPHGPFPVGLVPPDWSFNLNSKVMNNKAPKSVTVKRSDGQDVSTTYSGSLLDNGYGGGNWIKFVPDKKMVKVNFSYAVSITLDSGDVYSYDVMLTDCKDDIPDSVFEETMGFFVISAENSVALAFFALAGVMLISSLIFNSLKMRVPQSSSSDNSKSTSKQTIFV